VDQAWIRRGSGVYFSAIFAVGDPVKKVVGQHWFADEIALGLIAGER